MCIFQGLCLKDTGFLLTLLLAIWLCPTYAAAECGEDPLRKLGAIARETG